MFFTREIRRTMTCGDIARREPNGNLQREADREVGGHEHEAPQPVEAGEHAEGEEARPRGRQAPEAVRSARLRLRHLHTVAVRGSHLGVPFSIPQNSLLYKTPCCQIANQCTPSRKAPEPLP